MSNIDTIAPSSKPQKGDVRLRAHLYGHGGVEEVCLRGYYSYEDGRFYFQWFEPTGEPFDSRIGIGKFSNFKEAKDWLTTVAVFDGWTIKSKWKK
jgi:hypothetical protein